MRTASGVQKDEIDTLYGWTVWRASRQRNSKLLCVLVTNSASHCTWQLAHYISWRVNHASWTVNVFLSIIDKLTTEKVLRSSRRINLSQHIPPELTPVNSSWIWSLPITYYALIWFANFAGWILLIEYRNTKELRNDRCSIRDPKKLASFWSFEETTYMKKLRIALR